MVSLKEERRKHKELMEVWSEIYPVLGLGIKIDVSRLTRRKIKSSFSYMLLSNLVLLQVMG